MSVYGPTTLVELCKTKGLVHCRINGWFCSTFKVGPMTVNPDNMAEDDWE